MNDKIKELALQAGFQHINDEGIGWAGNHNASLPKFAELIIRDCISQIALFGVSNYENDDISWTVENSIKSIKEHFIIKD